MNILQLYQQVLPRQLYSETPWGNQLPKFIEGDIVYCKCLDVAGVTWGRAWLSGINGAFWQYRIQLSPNNCLWLPESDLEELDSHRGSGRNG